MTQLPWTPDFDTWPVTHRPVTLAHTPDALSVVCGQMARVSRHHTRCCCGKTARMRRPSTPRRARCASRPAPSTPICRITAVQLAPTGAVQVTFSDATTAAYHPGWLRGTAWFGDEAAPAPVLWRAADLPEPPSFRRARGACEAPATFLAWLEALRDYGVARSARAAAARRAAGRGGDTQIGPIRESNFGRQYTLEIKDDPDSQAYTSDMLLQHIDLPTRECPFGLQFLYTRENTTTGGEGLYADAYRIAEDMRVEEPGHFHSLVTDAWEYNNRARSSDYRGRGPVVETDAEGRITGVRYNTFLRAPLRAPLHVQDRAYKAYRAFAARAQDARYMMSMRYEPGDLLAFDNRRALHGRAGYEARGGKRFIEGIYSDRDELYSRIRMLKRQMRAEVGGMIPARMAAVHLTGYGGLDRLEYRTDVPVPRPGAGEVLIRVAAAGMNNTDINTRTGWYNAQVGDGTTAQGGQIGVRGAVGRHGRLGRRHLFPAHPGGRLRGPDRGRGQRCGRRRAWATAWFAPPISMIRTIPTGWNMPGFWGPNMTGRSRNIPWCRTAMP